MINKLDQFWQRNREKFEEYISKNKISNYEEFSPLKAITYIRMANIFRSLFPQERFSALEIGSGSGLILSYLTEEGAFCVGLDISKEAHKYSRLISLTKGIIIDLINSDYKEGLPFCDNSFDIVFSNGVIEHEEQKTQRFLIQEMSRISKKFVSHSIPNSKGIYKIFEREVIGKSEPDYSIDEKSVELNNLFRVCNLEIILNDGLLIYTEKSRLKSPDKDIVDFYNKINFNLPENYGSQDLRGLIAIEEQLTPKERLEIAFLKLYIAKKQGV